MTSTGRNSNNDNNSLPPEQPTDYDAQSQLQLLPVKELAAALGVGVRFIYQMRACGFPMRGETRHQQMATLEQARAWIKANDFRLIHSAGVIGPHTPKEIPSGGII